MRKTSTRKTSTRKTSTAKTSAAKTSTRELLDALQTTSYATWAKAINKLLKVVTSLNEPAITEVDLLVIMRPYMWWRHNPGFVDVAATCEAAMPVILAHMAEFGDKGKQVSSFLATYLDDGKHDRQCEEMDIYVACETWKSMVKGAEAKAIRALSELMNDIYGNKHTAYNVLRYVGWQQAATLSSLIHGLTPADQGFILHALDGSLSKPGVKKFYKDFIAKTPYPHLKKEARHHALFD